MQSVATGHGASGVQVPGKVDAGYLFAVTPDGTAQPGGVMGRYASRIEFVMEPDLVWTVAGCASRLDVQKEEIAFAAAKEALPQESRFVVQVGQRATQQTEQPSVLRGTRRVDLRVQRQVVKVALNGQDRRVGDL